MNVIKIRKKTCKKCIYSGLRSWVVSCEYCLIEGRSRIWENGERTVEKGYCNKYVPIKNVEEKERVEKLKRQFHRKIVINNKV